MVSKPVTRAMGAFKNRMPDSAMFAAISAPTPPVLAASCMMRHRPVFSTDAKIVSISKGLIVATSIISASMFS